MNYDGVIINAETTVAQRRLWVQFPLGRKNKFNFPTLVANKA